MIIPRELGPRTDVFIFCNRGPVSPYLPSGLLFHTEQAKLGHRYATFLPDHRIWIVHWTDRFDTAGI